MTHALEGDWYMVSRISSVLRRHRNSEETRKTKSFISPARLAFLSIKFCIGNRKKIWLLWFLSAKYHYDPGHIELGALPNDTPWMAVIWHLLSFAWDETWAGVSIPRGVPREACRWPCYLSHRIIALLLRTKGGPGNQKHSKNIAKYHFPTSSNYTESLKEFKISSQNHRLTPLWKIQYGCHISQSKKKQMKSYGEVAGMQ